MTALDQAGRPAGSGEGTPVPSRRVGAPALVVVLSCVAAALPLVVAAVALLVADVPVVHRGDQALIASSTARALELEQLLGAYSRYGWRHPGPAWNYLMSVPFGLSGRTDAGLVAASLLVHALMAALLVAAGSSLRRPVQAPLLALVVLGWYVSLPGHALVDVWNPCAQLLPAALLVVMAGRAARGSVAAFVSCLAIASYLVQAHVGGLVLSGLVLVAAAGSLAWRWHRRLMPPAAAWSRGAVLAAAVTTVVLWLPPLVEELRGGQGNMTAIARFFLGEPPEGQAGSHSLRDAVVAVGKLLVVVFTSAPLGPFELDLTSGVAAALAALGAFLAACGTVLVLALRQGAPAAAATAAMTATATGAAVVAVLNVTGPVYWFVVVWALALPLGLAAAVVQLLAEALSRRVVAGKAAEAAEPPSRRDPAARLSVAGLCLLALAGGALVAPVMTDRAELVESSEGVEALVSLTRPVLGLPGPQRSTVVVDIGTSWLAAAGLVRALEADGWEVSVNADYVWVFGEQYAAPARPDVRIRLTDPATPASGTPAGTAETEDGPVAVHVEPAPGRAHP